MANRNIIVIGGSSGATAPLKAILGQFPPDFPAAVFVAAGPRRQPSEVVRPAYRPIEVIPF